MSVKIPVGAINIATDRICIGRGLAAIRAGQHIDSDYLCYRLLSSEAEIRGNEGAVFPSINQSQIQSIELPLPRKDHQRRIVAKVEQAFAEIDRAIENMERAMEESAAILATEREGLLVDRPDWECATLGDIVDIRHGFAFKSEWFTDHGDHVLLTPGNFYETGGYRYRGDKLFPARRGCRDLTQTVSPT